MMPPDAPNAPLDDPARLAALAQVGLTPKERSPGDKALDRLASLAGKVLRAPVGLVSLVEKDRQVFQGMVGLPEPWSNERESPIEYSFCQHVVTAGVPLVVDDAKLDPRVCGNPSVVELGVAAYLGVPLTTPEGLVLGSLCVFDVQPRQWTSDDLETLTGLATFANTELQLRRASREIMESAGHDRERAIKGADATYLLVHDLRTPLNSLLLGLQTLPLLGALNAEQREILDLAARGGQALMSLVNDMLDLSSAEATPHGLTLHRAALVPAEILESAVRQVSSLARQRGIELTSEAAPAGKLPATFEGDADKLIRALVNLLGNAIKFTPTNGRIVASVSGGEGAIMFSVRDTGRGIAPADHQRIFDRFVRVGRDSDGDGGRSSGLGLAFCKMVAGAHGGEITVESELGQGSTFCLRVPASR